MPYSNFHACRIHDPGQYDRIKTARGSVRGKAVNILIGYKGGKTEVQSFHYDVKRWTEEQASSHCRSHNGTFHKGGE